MKTPAASHGGCAATTTIPAELAVEILALPSHPVGQSQPIYTAVNAEAARAALEELTEKWGPKYGAIIRLWNNAWEEFIPFLDYDVEIRTVLCSTNAIVIWSLPEGVVDVRDGAVRCRDLPAGRGYLLRSSRQILGRFDVRSTGGGGRAAA